MWTNWNKTNQTEKNNLCNVDGGKLRFWTQNSLCHAYESQFSFFLFKFFFSYYFIFDIHSMISGWTLLYFSIQSLLRNKKLHSTFVPNQFFRSATAITKIGMSMYVTGFEYGVQKIHRSESRCGKNKKRYYVWAIWVLGLLLYSIRVYPLNSTRLPVACNITGLVSMSQSKAFLFTFILWEQKKNTHRLKSKAQHGVHCAFMDFFIAWKLSNSATSIVYIQASAH